MKTNFTFFFSLFKMWLQEKLQLHWAGIACPLSWCWNKEGMERVHVTVIAAAPPPSPRCP